MSRDGVLSPRQESILRVIRNSITECGEGPTVRQIGERVGLSSTSSVAYQLGRLEALGLISRSAAAAGAPAGSAPESVVAAGQDHRDPHPGPGRASTVASGWPPLIWTRADGYQLQQRSPHHSRVLRSRVMAWARSSKARCSC
ncbi:MULTISPECIES: MarR family transcriptional regulator [unclassified Streptomyces]|uniref:LexA family protein n=1 Tax=unclassified Streptomyces TaxID=2593676 RepID=UPI0029B83B07|nr:MULTISPECIES: MarR family transcriptional regulator [unclassified Streptomyces]MDX3772049.1 MarR family transcriptional regulator [Streptomyces sp. AK08-01B]MDX3821574.1 MarR family transcriptional regulator [Streptomyces sp. AK08-01A]